MSKYFKLNLNDIMNQIQSYMTQYQLHSLLIEDFNKKVLSVYQGETGLIDFKNVLDLNKNDIINLNELPFQLEYDSKITHEISKKLAIIKLNGGLGTSMGLNKAKTLLKVKEHKTFLDIILDQVKILRSNTNVDVPLIFMNSFNTSNDTINYPGVKDINQKNNIPVEFIQNKVPRLLEDTLLPFGDGSESKHWCPPGHGDIYISLKISGLLELLLNQGIEYVFISNGDNLGAIFEPSILAYMIENDLDFISEVTPKTVADIKGGVLYRNRITNRIELLETAQVPPENKKDFEDTSKFKDFNINNLWVNLKSLNRLFEHGTIQLPLIINPKEVDGKKVLQLETAMGAAIGQFDKTKIIRVPRNRFAPVKKCNDLLVRKSDAYILNQKNALIPNPNLKQEPIVKLSNEYDHIENFESLFKEVPSLIDCTQLNIQGKFLFDIKLKISGKVELNNNSDEIIKISDMLKQQSYNGIEIL